VVHENGAQTLKSFRWAFGLGTITIAIMVWLGLTGPTTACGGSALAPVVAFQAMRFPSDLIGLFGSEPSDCRTGLIDALRLGTQRDLIFFIPVYAMFLALVGLAFKAPRALTWILFAFLFITVVGDIVETVIQLNILAAFNEAPSQLSYLIWGNGLKTFGLSLFLGGIAYLFWLQGTPFNRWSALVLIALAILRTAGLWVAELRSFTPLTAFFGYFLVWIHCAVHVAKR
jgi:hypothetical protein